MHIVLRDRAGQLLWLASSASDQGKPQLFLEQPHSCMIFLTLKNGAHRAIAQRYEEDANNMALLALSMTTRAHTYTYAILAYVLLIRQWPNGHTGLISIYYYIIKVDNSCFTVVKKKKKINTIKILKKNAALNLVGPNQSWTISVIGLKKTKRNMVELL